MNRVVRTLITPAHPHPLLAPDRNPGWGRVRDAYEQAGAEIRASGADLIILYSTLWPSIIGHQIQADPNPVWNLVDPDFHALGTIDYDLRIDAEFAHAWDAANTARGLTSRTVAYHGFPIDVGSVVALKLLDPEGRIPAVICSSNVYSDRAETTVLAKACRDALEQTGRTAAVVGVMSLSNRMFTTTIDPAEDRIHSLKDDEWNRKILDLLGEGRLEDVAQLSRTIHDQIRVKKVVSFKPMWWLSSMNGEHNRFKGDVLAYEPIHGAGAAVVVLTPSADASGDKEYDEDGVETFTGDRGVLDSIASNPSETDLLVHRPEDPGIATWDPTDHGVSINATEAPRPVGPYPHARRVGDMIYLSGVGPRQAGSNSIPGGPIRDDDGPLEYDIRAQTQAVIDNIRAILEADGLGLEHVVDVTSFLVDMDRDFQGYNEVYAANFASIGPTRTTLAIDALPTPIAVEMKVIAHAG